MPDNTTNIKVAGYQRGVAEVGCKTARRLENEMKKSWHTQRMVVYRGLIANISSAPWSNTEKCEARDGSFIHQKSDEGNAVWN